MKSEHSLTTYTEVNSEWINDPIVRLDIIKHLEKNLAGHSDINHSDIFDPFPTL